MRSVRLDVSWGRLHVWEEGSGPATILAVHGLGGSGRYWDGFAEVLGEGYRVVAPDLGGFGGSTKPMVPADRAFHLEALDSVARSAGIGEDEPCIVVGHSLGGVLGLLWSASRPEAVTGLVMAASPYPTPHPEWNPARWKGVRGVIPRALVATAKAGWPVVSLPIQALGPYPAPVVRDFGRQSIRSRVWTLWSLWGDPGLEVVARDAAVRLDGSGASILLAHATDDRSVGSDQGDQWAEALPGASQLLVPDGGHQFLLRGGFAAIAPWIRRVGERG